MASPYEASGRPHPRNQRIEGEYIDRLAASARLGLGVEDGSSACDQVSIQASLSAELRDRLLDLIQVLDEADGNLHGFRQRMFGPWPEAAGIGPAPLDVEGKLPTADGLIRLLGTAAGRARSVMLHTRVVNSAI